jgi:RNA polymerase-binding transcription factor DksA
MKDTQYFKDLLNKERGNIVEQLKTLGRLNPDDKNDWQTLKPESDDVADDLDVAESIQQYESDNAVLETLETRLHEVEHALSKIEEGRGCL